jgi:YHS domain-containing protein
MQLIKSVVAASLVFVSLSAFAAKGEFGDLCVTGLAMGKEVPTDCSMSTAVGGKTYCFSGAKAKEMFMADQGGMVKKAEDQFKMMMKK